MLNEFLNTRKGQVILKYMEIFFKILGIAFLMGLFFGWTWYIWCLAAGCSFWEKVLWVIGSYALCGAFLVIGSIPGVGCIPVKFDDRR